MTAEPGIMPMSHPRIALVALPLLACRTQADSAPPSPGGAAGAREQAVAQAPTERPRTEVVATTTTTTSPPPVDCSSATINEVLEGRTRWTNEGRTCLDRLAGACNTGNAEACLDAGTILVNGVGGVAKNETAALRLESDACAVDVARACLAAGVMLANGIGAASDADAARVKLTRGCELGDQDACRVAERLASTRIPDELVPDANLRVGSIAADGLELRDVACAVDDGPPMLGALVVVASLAKQHRAIDKCAPKGQAFAATWTFTRGKVKQPVVTGGSASANACVARAIAKAIAPFEARCGAFVLAGKPEAAAATLEAVRASRAGG